MPGVEIYKIPKDVNCRANMVLEHPSCSYAVRWPSGSGPFEGSRRVEISTRPSCTEALAKEFDSLAKENAGSLLNSGEIQQFLSGTRVIQVKEGSKQSWGDLLSAHLPDSIVEAKIYDRFLRNRFQFRSLEMFLDLLCSKAAPAGIKILITTTDEEGAYLKERFRDIQARVSKLGAKLRYELIPANQEIPHYRRVQIRGERAACSLWLDRGLDIFHFENLEKLEYRAKETYVVIDYD